MCILVRFEEGKKKVALIEKTEIYEAKTYLAIRRRRPEGQEVLIQKVPPDLLS